MAMPAVLAPATGATRGASDWHLACALGLLPFGTSADGARLLVGMPFAEKGDRSLRSVNLKGADRRVIVRNAISASTAATWAPEPGTEPRASARDPCAGARAACGAAADAAGMTARRAQSTVEALGLALAVGAVVVAAAAVVVRADAVAIIADAVRGGPPRAAAPAPSPAALAFLDRALEPGDAAPALHDAVGRLAAEVGPERAADLALTAALRRHLPVPGAQAEALADPALALARPDLDGVGAPRGDVWADVRPRAAPSARLVGLEAERAWRASLVPSRPERIADAAASGAAAAFGALNPAAAAAVLIAGGMTAAGADHPRGAPAGSREDDLVLCRPVWRVNRAAPDWVDRHPHEALRLGLGERVAAVELTVVRAGRVVQRAVLRSDATRC